MFGIVPFFRDDSHTPRFHSQSHTQVSLTVRCALDHPEMTLCSQQDVKMQSLTGLLTFERMYVVDIKVCVHSQHSSVRTLLTLKCAYFVNVCTLSAVKCMLLAFQMRVHCTFKCVHILNINNNIKVCMHC